MLDSCRRHLPGVPIVVADCSVQDGEPEPEGLAECRGIPGVTWLQMPFDSGVSVCRNAAVEAARTDLIFLTDDDHLFCEQSDLAGLVEVLRESKADIAAGCVQNIGRVDAWAWNLTGTPPNHRARPVSEPWKVTSGGRHWRGSTTFLNAFIARRETLLQVPWDNQFPIMEHRDHVMSCYEAGLKVVYSTCCIVVHDKTEAGETYGNYRWRKEEMDALLRAKRGYLPTFGRTEAQPVPLVSAGSDWPPNVILFGVGHSGTTITTRQLIALGLNPADADEEFAESVAVRDVNIELLATGTLPKRAAEVLADLPQPWVIKDPRFVNTLEDWLPLLKPYDPLLVYLTRDRDAMARSYERRKERRLREGLTLDETIAMANQRYGGWPWRKLTISLEEWATVCGMIDRSRLLL